MSAMQPRDFGGSPPEGVFIGADEGPGWVLFAWDPPTAAVVLIDLALVVCGVLLIAGIARAVRTST